MIVRSLYGGQREGSARETILQNWVHEYSLTIVGVDYSRLTRQEMHESTAVCSTSDRLRIKQERAATEISIHMVL